MIVYYAAMSLDGRISGPDHDLSFLRTLTAENDYEVFYAVSGTAPQTRSGFTSSL